MRITFLQFKKIICSKKFYLCILLTAILLFCSEIFSETRNGNRYSVIKALIMFSREDMLKSYELCNAMVMQNARSGWFSFFLPVLTGFCFVPSICAERENNALRFWLVRSSRLKFNLAQYLSGIISGGLVISFGYLIFCASVSFMFPDISEYGESNGVYLNSFLFNFPKAMLGMFLNGVFWGIPAMLGTCISRNKYLILCVPTFIKYSFTQLRGKLSAVIYSSDEISPILKKVISSSDPDALMFIGDYPDFRWVLLVFGLFGILFSVGFFITQGKRSDCGA